MFFQLLPENYYTRLYRINVNIGTVKPVITRRPNTGPASVNGVRRTGRERTHEHGQGDLCDEAQAGTECESRANKNYFQAPVGRGGLDLSTEAGGSRKNPG